MRTIAVLSVGSATVMPVFGHEINIKMDEIGSINPKVHDGGKYSIKFTGKRLSKMAGDSDSIAVKIPVFYSSNICKLEYNTFLRIHNRETGSEFRLRQNFESQNGNASREFSLGKREFPFIEHHQYSDDVLKTEYPILDPIQKEICSKVNNGEYDSGNYTITIFINSYNTFLQVVRNGIPIHDVYISPINFGSGDDIMDLIRRSSINVNFHIDSYSIDPDPDDVGDSKLPCMVKIYSFKWSDLLNDLNLNYGAKSIPVLSPVVDMGNGAAAAILISTN
ncbi:hypothetical protein [Sphingopyxis panaciterrulae]|uniref:Uncharacterized protein n=1 Tax=Sphingopyxis panaciterrulae TaxID=462372 RepID=A0A7W9B996_9SPHN|nr:hypothetical protein [Sphingopyxis panaciterrulae]MBB5708609.1 hypothetical protein [Sphingopyxis panaciterrulae]